MMPDLRRCFTRIGTPLAAMALMFGLNGCAFFQSRGPGKQMLETNARNALQTLVSQNPSAAYVSRQAVAVLVFPSVVKGGFIYGAAAGNGVLFRHGIPAGVYNTTALSYGLQAGLQDYGYALFFMNEKALNYLQRSEGFEIGAGPSVVVADKGFAKSYTSTTLTQDVYAFVFNQTGLMAGLGLTGSKITQIAAP